MPLRAVSYRSLCGSGRGILFGSYALTRCEPRLSIGAMKLRVESRVSCYARRCLRGHHAPPSQICKCEPRRPRLGGVGLQTSGQLGPARRARVQLQIGAGGAWCPLKAAPRVARDSRFYTVPYAQLETARLAACKREAAVADTPPRPKPRSIRSANSTRPT
jgi:hypothetical protein